MPEWGMLPIPKKLLRQGVRDMLRISDARMSGTSYGACILHVSPEAHIGGPLAAVRTGDLITVDVPNRSIHLHVSDEQIKDRLSTWSPPPRDYARGYNKLFAQHIRRLTKAATSTSWRGPAACPSPKSTNPPHC
jgi:dihydroxyacid dehydratase/phosphogluconate dehydratase